MSDKLIWSWSSDATVVYVFRVYQTRFLKRWRMQEIRYYNTDCFINVVDTAEAFIKRYEEMK